MPIHIRRFFIKRIEQTLKQEQKRDKKAADAAKSKSRIKSPKFRR
tara:strand:- start:549 stop:683 length:135 start_codon:yes stop_codon:yes gene_type:complete